ncbi:MAG: class I SAM-dependent methyltransferase [Anaerolineae bacterium]|jgi:ubiquinone/menaquinone biosynthesis C-methylase UbiE
MLSRAGAKVPAELEGCLSFQRMDLNARLLFPDAHFDHVVNISVLQVTVDPLFTLGEFWRVLKPGGTLLLLHVPRPDSHRLPLREIIRHRIGNLEAKSVSKIALIVLKSWAERTNHARYWTLEELGQMLEKSQLEVIRADHGPPIIMIAERPIAVHLT